MVLNLKNVRIKGGLEAALAYQQGSEINADGLEIDNPTGKYGILELPAASIVSQLGIPDDADPALVIEALQVLKENLPTPVPKRTALLWASRFGKWLVEKTVKAASILGTIATLNDSATVDAIIEWYRHR
jgi:hypothetical protein